MNANRLKYVPAPTKPKKPSVPKSLSFKVDGVKVPYNSEILNKFFDSNPQDFVDYKEFVMVVPRPKIDPKSEMFQVMLKKLVPYIPPPPPKKPRAKKSKKAATQTAETSTVNKNPLTTEGVLQAANASTQALSATNSAPPANQANESTESTSTLSLSSLVDSNGFVSGRVLKSLGLTLPGSLDSRYKLTPHLRELLFGDVKDENADADEDGKQESRKRKVDEIIIDDDDDNDDDEQQNDVQSVHGAHEYADVNEDNDNDDHDNDDDDQDDDDDEEDTEDLEPAKKKQKRSNKNPFVDSEAEEDDD